MMRPKSIRARMTAAFSLTIAVLMLTVLLGTRLVCETLRPTQR